jgi:hypothetical protein
MALKDRRIKMMNEVLNGIKVLKLYAWEIAFIRRLNDVREDELQCIRKKAIISAISSATWAFAPIIVNNFLLIKETKFFTSVVFKGVHYNICYICIIIREEYFNS